MYTPNSYRDSFIKYLRSGYPYNLPWMDPWGKHPAIEVKKSLQALSKTDPELYQVIHLYMTSHMTRYEIEKRVSYEYSTVKRKLDYAIDCILNHLANRDLVQDSGINVDGTV